MAETKSLRSIEGGKGRKTEQQVEIERLMAMSNEELTKEDLKLLGRIRDCRVSLTECEKILDELKESRKLKMSELDAAISQAVTHFDSRQLALNFTPASG